MQTFLERLLRQRWMLAGAGIFSALGMVAIATPSTSLPPGGQTEIIEQLNLLANAPLSLGDEGFLREERIVRGDTFDRLLARLGVYDDAARRYIHTAPELQNLHRLLAPGRVVSAYTHENGELVRLIFPLPDGERVTLVERRQGQLTSRIETLQVDTRQVIKSGEIRYSLFGATDGANIPDAIAVQMAEIFSGDIDFHRDLRKGDRFTLVYEMQFYQGRPARSGRILSAEFVNNGQAYQAFYFEQDGKGQYYNARGQRLQKAFLRSPLEFSRVTSGFSMRFHPILKTWRAHKGIDYGAPTGTKIRATGDGVVEFIGTQKGYGNFVLLSHAGGYQTAYAHMSGFAAGLEKGDRIGQGELVGYVGSTGWATGPHLHYEFRVKGQAINPLSIDIPTAIPLAKTQQAAFDQQASTQLAQLQLFRDVPAVRFE
ncbi:MAG: M23 family metallopeptidase [Zoogloeaceae bacterium]|nr:M23 family metallopeptidase [Zoogloeaceae bacterium]